MVVVVEILAAAEVAVVVLAAGVVALVGAVVAEVVLVVAAGVETLAGVVAVDVTAVRACLYDMEHVCELVWTRGGSAAFAGRRLPPVGRPGTGHLVYQLPRLGAHPWGHAAEYPAPWLQAPRGTPGAPGLLIPSPWGAPSVPLPRWFYPADYISLAGRGRGGRGGRGGMKIDVGAGGSGKKTTFDD